METVMRHAVFAGFWLSLPVRSGLRGARFRCVPYAETCESGFAVGRSPSVTCAWTGTTK